MPKTFDFVNYGEYEYVLDEGMIKWIYIFNIMYPIIKNYDETPELIKLIESSSLFKKINNNIKDSIKSITLCITLLIIINT